MGGFWLCGGDLVFFCLGFLGHWVLVYCYPQFTLLSWFKSGTYGIVRFSLLPSPQLRDSHSLLKQVGLGEDKM